MIGSVDWVDNFITSFIVSIIFSLIEKETLEEFVFRLLFVFIGITIFDFFLL